MENLWLDLPVWLGSYATGIKLDVDVGFLAINSISNYEHLCALNVQGLTDTLDRDQQKVHKEFRDS